METPFLLTFFILPFFSNYGRNYGRNLHSVYHVLRKWRWLLSWTISVPFPIPTKFQVSDTSTFSRESGNSEVNTWAKVWGAAEIMSNANLGVMSRNAVEEDATFKDDDDDGDGGGGGWSGGIETKREHHRKEENLRVFWRRRLRRPFWHCLRGMGNVWLRFGN